MRARALLPTAALGLLLLLAACGMPARAPLELSLTGVTPARGSYGTPLVIAGAGIHPDATVELCGRALDGASVAGEDAPVMAGPGVHAAVPAGDAVSGTVPVVAEFGACDLVVTNPDGSSVRLPAAFEHVPPATATGIGGRVLGPDGAPAEGASVVAHASSTTECGATDAAGFYACDVPDGTYTLIARHEGLAAALAGVKVVGATRADDLRLAEPAVLDLTVVDGNGAPAQNALVALGDTGIGGVTDEGGTLMLADLPAGSFGLRVEHEAHDPYVRPVDLTAGARVALTVTLDLSNTAPVGGDAAVAFSEDQADASVDLGELFSDPDGDALTYAVTSNTAPALLTPAVSGATLTLALAPDAHGTAALELRAQDPSGATATALLNVTVAPVNDAPTALALDDVAAEEGDGPVTVDLAGIFRDPDGDALTLTIAGNTDPALVDAAITGSLLTLTLAPDGYGTAEVTVSASDPAGASAAASLTVTVSGALESVLYYADFFVGTDYPRAALTAAGYDVAYAISGADFDQKLATGSYGIAIALVQDSSPAIDLQTLTDHVAGGGRAVFTDWTRNAGFGALFEASYTGRGNATIMTLTPPLDAGLSSPATLVNPGWGAFSMGLQPTGDGVSYCTFENGDSCLVVGNGGRTVLLGFLADTPTEGTQLFTNVLEFLE